MMTRVEVMEWHGEYFEVKFNYTPPDLGSRDVQPMGPEYDVQEVWLTIDPRSGERHNLTGFITACGEGALLEILENQLYELDEQRSSLRSTSSTLDAWKRP